ncbi:4229_t:CDS:2, partial [Racocetra fulgida]
DANFINGIKETVVNLYENNYMLIVHETDSDQEQLKIDQKTEIELYLKAP